MQIVLARKVSICIAIHNLARNKLGTDLTKYLNRRVSLPRDHLHARLASSHWPSWDLARTASPFFPLPEHCSPLSRARTVAPWANGDTWAPFLESRHASTPCLKTCLPQQRYCKLLKSVQQSVCPRVPSQQFDRHPGHGDTG